MLIISSDRKTDIVPPTPPLGMTMSVFYWLTVGSRKGRVDMYYRNAIIIVV